jgi:hypothetical protein
VGLTGSRTARTVALVAALTAAAALAAPAPAAAQRIDPTFEGSEISSTPKGTIGMGLIGAELGLVVPALAGLKGWYWYVLFPAVGGVGGALAGWYVIDKPGREKAAVAMLATGMALLLPALLVTAWKTSYDPGEDPTVVHSESLAEAKARERAREAGRRQRAGAGVMRRSEDGWLLGAPGVSVTMAQTPKEQLLLGTAPPPEVHVPLLTGVF